MSRDAISYAQLLAKGYVQQPDGSWSKPALVVARLPDTKPKPVAREKSLAPHADEKGSEARSRVSINRRARRLLDVDNLAGAKLIIDQLRYAGLIPDDSPEQIDLELRQQKVSSKTEEGTEITITTETRQK